MKNFSPHTHIRGSDDPFLIQTDAVKNRSVGALRARWVEDSVSAPEMLGGRKPLTEFLGIGGSRTRLFGVGILLAAAMIALLGRAAFIQIVESDHFHLLAEHNRIRTTPLLPERGIVYDAQHIPLVRNVSSFTAYLLPQDMPAELSARFAALQHIGDLLNISPAYLQSKMDEFKSYQFQEFAIKDNIDYDTAIRLMLLSKDVPGISIESSLRRHYLLSSASSTQGSALIYDTPSLGMVLGYEGKMTKDELDLISNSSYLPVDRIGKSGIEKSYENVLRGIRGKREIEVDALGKAKDVIVEEPSKPGDSVILNIDLAYQNALEKAVDDQLKGAPYHRVSAIVMDPRDGSIRALAMRPAVDSNLFAQGISTEVYNQLVDNPDNPLFTRAWSGSFPSGSVIKPLIAAAALTEHVITRNTTVVSVGGLQVGNWFFPDWKVGGHGVTNVIKALAESVNTFFFMVGGGYKDFAGLGPDRIVEYLKKFGLDNTLGIDLPSEAPGFLPTPEWKQEVKHEQWYIGDTYNMSIGQGDVLVTPLQVAAYTAAVANGGTLYAPHVAHSIVDTVTGVETLVSPHVIAGHIVPPDSLAIVREGMRAAVTSGSARPLNTLPIEIAGKTGTAQWSKTKPPHAWFTAFAPYDAPQIVITVLVEEGGGGDQVSVPIAKRFLTWYSTHKAP